MVGSAVATMLWFSAARNAASIRPKKMVRTSAWLTGAGGGAMGAGGRLRARRAAWRSRRFLRARTAAFGKFIAAAGSPAMPERGTPDRAHKDAPEGASQR